MKTFLFEARNVVAAAGGGNWGKFLVGLPDEEWRRLSVVDGRPLLRGQGWGRRHVLVVDLATGEGAMFVRGGLARADLNKHRIWVCVLFEAFLQWLYRQDLENLEALQREVVWLPHVPVEQFGYRRQGPCVASDLDAGAATGQE